MLSNAQSAQQRLSDAQAAHRRTRARRSSGASTPGAASPPAAQASPRCAAGCRASSRAATSGDVGMNTDVSAAVCEAHTRTGRAGKRWSVVAGACQRKAC